MRAKPSGFDQRHERTAVAVLAADQEPTSGRDRCGRLQDGEIRLQQFGAATARRRRSTEGRPERGHNAWRLPGRGTLRPPPVRLGRRAKCRTRSSRDWHEWRRRPGDRLRRDRPSPLPGTAPRCRGLPSPRKRREPKRPRPPQGWPGRRRSPHARDRSSASGPARREHEAGAAWPYQRSHAWPYGRTAETAECSRVTTRVACPAQPFRTNSSDSSVTNRRTSSASSGCASRAGSSSTIASATRRAARTSSLSRRSDARRRSLRPFCRVP